MPSSPPRLLIYLLRLKVKLWTWCWTWITPGDTHIHYYKILILVNARIQSYHHFFRMSKHAPRRVQDAWWFTGDAELHGWVWAEKSVKVLTERKMRNCSAGKCTVVGEHRGESPPHSPLAACDRDLLDQNRASPVSSLQQKWQAWTVSSMMRLNREWLSPFLPWLYPMVAFS